MEYKQFIIINKELEMTPAKLAVQVAHASNQFMFHSEITNEIREYWMENLYAKVILKVKNENQLLKFIDKAKEFGFDEGVDFWRIVDEGRTEFNNCKTLTGVGFKPMDPELIRELTRKLQLYK